ncbi:MAG TPA: hypothetical protein VF281_01910 [Candidatus Saccharimonadales bacterium]
MIDRNFAKTDIFQSKSEATDLYFKDGPVSYQQAVIDPILMQAQPFEYDALSPTPLDPFHLSTTGLDYYRAASILTEGRLLEAAEKYNIPDDVQELAHQEVEIEHERQSHKNNASMRKYRESLRSTERFSVEKANDIIAARAAVSTIGRLGLLLAEHPVVGGVEVMKWTAFFDNRSTMLAHATFVSRMQQENMNQDSDFEIIGGKVQMARADLMLNTAENVGSEVIAFKGKEADVIVAGRHLELIGRYAFIALHNDLHIEGMQPVNVPVGNTRMNLQSLGMQKYLRIAKPTEEA